MKQFFGSLFGRLGNRPVLAIAAFAALAVVIVSAFAATPVVAQSTPPASCFEAMESAQPQGITFYSATYTVTVPFGQDVCVDSATDLLLGFMAPSPFAVDGNGASKVPAPGNGYLYPQGPISGTLAYKLEAPVAVKLELTDVNNSGGTILVWLGNLKVANAASATPTPVASAINLNLVGPGTLPRLPANAPEPKWDVRPVAGSDSLVLHLEAGVVFTPTTQVGGQYPTAASCGDGCWQADLPTYEGVVSAPALKGWWWTATLVGSADARVLMPAPASAGPTTGKVQYKNAAGQFFATANCTGTPVSQDMAATIRTCGGARGRIAGAPASRLPYLPLILKP